MAKISLITTGGTIASRRDPSSDQVLASVSGVELRASLHDSLEGIELSVDEWCNIGSFCFDLPLAFSLAGRINEHLADSSCDGVVVTHGTDTMEESAYMADLLVATDKPVVFTGAQRNADAPDTDGPRNIGDAVRLAASPKAVGLGAMILFEQEFHAARDATKTHASRVDTFASGEHGKLGEVDGETISLHRRPVVRRTYAPSRIEPDIELIKLAMGSGDRYLRFAVDNGAKAIVLEAFGRGNATPDIAKAVSHAVSNRVPVIVTSRCSRGRVKPIYGDGGGKDMQRCGGIFAGDLAGPKARLLASVLMGLGLDEEEMRREFEYHGG